MQVSFYGTRGSLPVPGPGTIRYGGNTSCVGVRSAKGTLVVLDMGTGAFGLGQELAKSAEPVRGHVLITHTHWDHIQGIPFFAPFFRPGNHWDVYAPRGLGDSLHKTLSGQMQYTYFPLELEQLGATIRYHDLVEGALVLDDVTVQTQYLNHPALTLGYRLTADGASVVYALDHEPFDRAASAGTGPLGDADRRHVEFLRSADLVIHDAQYLADEYAAKAGWGHSTVEYALRVAQEAGARRVALAHHDPNRTDPAIDAILATFAASAGEVELLAATEGRKLTLRAPPQAAAASPTGAMSTATMEPALKDQSVLLTGSDNASLAPLAEILRSDGIPVTAMAPSAVPEAVAQGQPSLVLIGERDPSAVRALTRAVRALGAQGRDLPIILVGDSQEGPSNEELGVSDRLVAPFSPSYARTRLRAWLMRRACRWKRPDPGKNEAERLAALEALKAFEGGPDPHLDGLVRLGADLFQVPMAAVTLVERDWQRNRASCGLDANGADREQSFCAHVVAQPWLLVVPDTLLDDRFADNPQVQGPPGLRFYAGHPLVLSNGHCVGAFCIADVKPRELDAHACSHLAALAELALRALEPGAAKSAVGSR